MTKYIPYLIYLWLIAMHQVFLKDLTSILGVTINLTILILLLLSLYKLDITVAWFGFAAGIIAFSGSSFVLGWMVLIMVIIGYLSSYIKERLNLDSFYSRLLLILGGVFIHNMIILLLSHTDNFVLLIFTKVIPGAIYTTVIAWIYFLFKEGKITTRKVKSIF